MNGKAFGEVTVWILGGHSDGFCQTRFEFIYKFLYGFVGCFIVDNNQGKRHFF